MSIKDFDLKETMFDKKQVGMFIAGFCLAMGGALAILPNGETMTLEMLGEVPIVAWFNSVAAGVTSAMGMKKVSGE